MSAWGKTGRVTVKRCGRFHDPEHDRTVRVDGKRTGGTVVKVNGSSDDWFVEMLGPDGPSWSDNLPTSDAAVLWVLRRVDPALWRQERGEVPAVFPTPHGEWMVSYVSGRVVNPSWFDTRDEAFAHAHRVAAKAATR